MSVCNLKAVLSLLVALTLMTKALPSIPLAGPMNASEWYIETVDSVGDVGELTSLALDARGFPHITYRDETNRNLKYAKWMGDHWQIETVDSDGNVGRFSSIDVDRRGYPHISYHDDSNADLKYAKWTGIDWTIQVVDSVGDVGRDNSIALDSKEFPHIAYHEMHPIRDLKYARWTGTEWVNETVDYVGDVGWYPSIDIDSKDLPHISYFDIDNTDIKYTRWDGKKWNTETVDPSGIVGGSALALDSVDSPHIAYASISDHDLLYAKHDGTRWQLTAVDWIDMVGASHSIAVDGNDYPHISHMELGKYDLKYTYYDGSRWHNETVDSHGVVGFDTSIAMDVNGNPHISYYNKSSGDLKYATKAKLGADSPPVADAGPDQSVDVGVAVQFDGSGSFDPDSGWENFTIDSAGDTGGHVSTTVDISGNSHISYFDFTKRLLKYAKWDGTKWTDQVVDLAGHVYPHTSIALDSSGYPHISYNGGDVLKHAWWDGTTWTNETVDSAGIVGRYGSIALDSNDHPHISYHDWTNRDLKYARWNGSSWSIEIVDSVGSVGTWVSLALDDNDHPHISYCDHTHGDLKYARWNGSAWTNETVDSEGYVGRATSIALDSSNRPRISYQHYSDRDLRLATWVNGSWFVEKVDFQGDLAHSTSLALDSNDHPHISYNDFLLGDLKYARWDGQGWWIQTVESAGNVGGSSSIAIDENDSPHMSYYDKTNGNLDYVRKSGAGLTYDWDFGDGSPHGSGPNPTHVYTFPGAFLVTLTVTDANGGTDSDNCVITAIDSNQPPVADGDGPYFVDEGSQLDLDGSGSYDPDNDTLYYRWDLDNDGTWDSSWSPTPTHTHTWFDDGMYIVVLQVRDAHNETATDSATVNVRDLAPAADFTWSPEPQDEGAPVQFTDDSISYPDGIISWSWEFGDGGMSTSKDPTHTFSDNGIYNVKLTVEDDDGSVDSASHVTTIRNVAPIANAGDDKEGFEVSTFTFNGSFYDPGANDTHEYEWDFDYDGITFDVEVTGQSVSHTWTDDFDGYVALRVTDDDGGVGVDTAHVLVKNVPPTVELEVLPIEVNASLRIAGEKWHDVSIELYEDGTLIFNGTIVRYPGSPDDQMLDISHLQIDVSKRYTATVRYTPEDDPVNGQLNGATPCWIILRFDDGQELWLHHAFNVQHPDRYVWEVDLTAAILSHGITFEATAFDPGADDLTFHWNFGDGTNVTNVYLNPNGTCPVSIVDTVTHAFPGSGTFTITVTVEDDDGGIVQISYTLTI
jgi:PKD repeat protein